MRATAPRLSPWAERAMSDGARALLRACPVRINVQSLSDNPRGPWVAQWSEGRVEGGDINRVVLDAVREATRA